jgi:hypothetical protein
MNAGPVVPDLDQELTVHRAAQEGIGAAQQLSTSDAGNQPARIEQHVEQAEQSISSSSCISAKGVAARRHGDWGAHAVGDHETADTHHSSTPRAMEAWRFLKAAGLAVMGLRTTKAVLRA